MDINFSQNGDSPPQRDPVNGLVVDLKFNDLSLLLESAKSWDLHFRQLQRGNLNTQLKQVIFPDFQLGYCAMDKQIDQMGTSPPGQWTFAFATGCRIIWRGRMKDRNDIIIYRPGSEINCQSWMGFNVMTLSIPESRLEQVSKTHQLRDALRLIRENDLVEVDYQAMNRFRATLMTLLHQFTQGINAINQFVLNGIAEELTLELCALLESPANRNRICSSTRRENAINHVREYLYYENKNLITVTDLYRIAGVSKRTLQYAFKEKFDMSPKHYLKAILLNKVHLSLSHAIPGEAKVADIAHQWGFWHMGQFSQDYKIMFGQLPSQTLNRNSF